MIAAENKGGILVSRDFINLVVKLLGSFLTDELSKLYGDRSTMYLNIVEYFNSRYETDEIRSSAKDAMLDNDMLEEENTGGK